MPGKKVGKVPFLDTGEKEKVARNRAITANSVSAARRRGGGDSGEREEKKSFCSSLCLCVCVFFLYVDPLLWRAHELVRVRANISFFF